MVFSAVPTDAISQLYLTGVGTRSFFDARTMYFYGFSEADVQRQIPIVHPVIDYANVFNRPVLRRRTELPGEPDEPQPRGDLLQSDLGDGAVAGLLPADQRRPDREDTRELPAARHCRRLHAPVGRSHLEAYIYRFRSDRSGRRSPRCAPTSITRNVKPDVGVTNFLPTGDINAGRVMPAVGA